MFPPVSWSDLIKPTIAIISDGRTITAKLTIIIRLEASLLPNRVCFFYNSDRRNFAMITVRRKFTTKWSLFIFTVGINSKSLPWTVYSVQETLFDRILYCGHFTQDSHLFKLVITGHFWRARLTTRMMGDATGSSVIRHFEAKTTQPAARHRSVWTQL